MPLKVGSRQLRGSRVQHQTLSDIDGGVKVSVHELYTFMVAS